MICFIFKLKSRGQWKTIRYCVLLSTPKKKFDATLCKEDFEVIAMFWSSCSHKLEMQANCLIDCLIDCMRFSVANLNTTANWLCFHWVKLCVLLFHYKISILQDDKLAGVCFVCPAYIQSMLTLHIILCDIMTWNSAGETQGYSRAHSAARLQPPPRWSIRLPANSSGVFYPVLVLNEQYVVFLL